MKREERVKNKRIQNKEGGRVRMHFKGEELLRGERESREGQASPIILVFTVLNE